MTRGKKIAVVVFFGLPCLCCFGGFGFVQYTINKAGANLSAEVAKTKALGMPVVPADLARNIPDSQNAAPEYVKAMAMTPENSELEKAIGTVAKGLEMSSITLKSEDKRNAPVAFGKLTAVVALLEKAADKPHCDFRTDYSAGFDALFPEFSEMKAGSKLLAFKAQEQSKAGDWRGALKTIRRMFRISRHAGESPTLIGMLVQCAIENIAHPALRQVVSHHRSNPELLAEAHRLMQEIDPLPSFKHALGGELVMSRVSLRKLRSISQFTESSEEARQPNPIENAVFSNKSLQNAFDKRMLEAYNYMVPLLPDDPGKWEQVRDASQKLEVRVENDDSVFNFMNQILFPVFSQAATAIGHLQAQRRLTETAILLFQAKNRGGTLPAKLSFGETSVDPFSKKPLMYKPAGTGFLLYSVGKDKVDNGGVRTSSSGNQRDVIVDMR